MKEQKVPLTVVAMLLIAASLLLFCVVFLLNYK